MSSNYFLHSVIMLLNSYICVFVLHKTGGAIRIILSMYDRVILSENYVPRAYEESRPSKYDMKTEPGNMK